MAAPIISALLGAAILLHTPARGGGPTPAVPAHPCCPSVSQLLQVRCDQVDSGALGPLCAEAIGFAYDAFEGTVCLVVAPAVEASAERRVDHQGAPPVVRSQIDAPANHTRVPALPRPLLVEEARPAARLDASGRRAPSPLPSPG